MAEDFLAKAVRKWIMTKDEAVAWASEWFVEAFNYQYFVNEAKAKRAAEALTILTGTEWRSYKSQMVQDAYFVEKSNPKV